MNKNHRWNKKELLFLKKHSRGKPFKELAVLFNEAFSLNLTLSQVKSGCCYYGIKTGLRGFTLIDISNKRIVPIGSEKVLDKRCGETYIKVSMENASNRNTGWQGTWIPKHYLIWEGVHGHKPAHHLIIFADQNKNNFFIDNLLLVSKREYFYMIKNNLLTSSTEITRANHAITKHKLAIVDAINRLTGDERHKKHYDIKDKYRRYQGRASN